MDHSIRGNSSVAKAFNESEKGIVFFALALL